VAKRVAELCAANEALQCEICERERTAELEARNQDLDAFAHTVAHDLQGLLTMIVGYLSNAVKYGGRTDEAIPPYVEIGFDGQHNGGDVRFWVRDNGPGIPSEDRERLFTSFTRLEEARAQGHGLGLSIVQRIVEKLGGEVGVESAPGQGSLFYFTLPAANGHSGANGDQLVPGSYPVQKRGEPCTIDPIRCQ
jgi:signal transduction histidine kinase